jgi:hypothetical protein
VGHKPAYKFMFEIIPTREPPGLALTYTAGNRITHRNAWLVAILKWKTLWQACREGRLIADGGVQTCGLCSLYYYGHDEECEECPIAIAGYPGCQDTPYQAYRQAVVNGDLEVATHTARRELVFLRRLSRGENDALAHE